LIQSKSLTSQISSIGLALFAGSLSIVCWRAGLLHTAFASFAIHSVYRGSELVTPGLWVAVLLVTAFSLANGITILRYGARRSWPYLAAGFIGMTATALLVLHFFAIDLLLLPLAVGGSLSGVFVQSNRLWRVDRQLKRKLFGSVSRVPIASTGEASSRLMSGLKLLNTVMPLSEAIVFQWSDLQTFETVARLKGSTSAQVESSRNSVWRYGIKLCERAVASGEIITEVVENNATTNVAVPLRHEEETVGALLLRLNSEFCEDDKALLQAVGTQFARNLQRDGFGKQALKDNSLGYLSRTAGQKKLDALSVLHGVLTEQRCEANALADISDGIAIAYLDGTLSLTNATLLNFASLNLEQTKTLDLFGLLDHFRTGVFDEPAIAVRRVLQTGADYEGELKFADRNQTFGLRISLLREKLGTLDGLGEPIGLAIYVRDLTRAKEYDQLKSDMISLMSHELRTPLTSINGFAELLTADETIPEQAREFVTIIANESQRLSRMINTFLAVTQLQRKDKQEVLKIPLRLDEVVRDIITTLQPMAKKKRIRLVEQPAFRLPPVAADKSLITQAVKNLVNNAIKYSPERTTVTVSTALEAEAVRVCVEDRGFGIPSESKDRVWEKFYRVVREGQEKDEESTGLGLSFVREVVEQHGGNVGLDSEEGRGSKFSFTLPRL
jgi:signal transduction histidine kinase